VSPYDGCVAVTPTRLRADLFHLLDQVLETGEPLEINRKGRTLRVVVDQPASKLSRIRPNPDAYVGEPEELIGSSPSEREPERTPSP